MLMEAFEEAKARGQSEGGGPSASDDVEGHCSVLAPTSRDNAVAGPSKKRKRNIDDGGRRRRRRRYRLHLHSPDKLDITEEEKCEREELERGDASPKPRVRA